MRQYLNESFSEAQKTASINKAMYRGAILQGSHNNKPLLDMLVCIGANPLPENNSFETGDGSDFFYINEASGIEHISIFDEKFIEIYNSHKHVCFGDWRTAKDRSMSVEKWNKLVDSSLFWSLFGTVFNLYDLQQLMPKTRWHIGNFKFVNNPVYADVKKVSKLHKYLFGECDDFKAKELTEYSRPTVCDANITISDSKEFTRFMVMLVNGNNGTTEYLEESLTPVYNFCKFVRDELDGKTIIEETTNHSDVYYYSILVTIKNK